MTHKSSGGTASWSGAAFELRLGVEFCVYILIGEDAGFGCGAATWVQGGAKATASVWHGVRASG